MSWAGAAVRQAPSGIPPGISPQARAGEPPFLSSEFVGCYLTHIVRCGMGGAAEAAELPGRMNTMPMSTSAVKILIFGNKLWVMPSK